LQLQTLQGARPQKAVQHQPFALSTEMLLAQQQLQPDRHQDFLEDHGQWIAGENLPVKLLQPCCIEMPNRAQHLRLPFAPLTLGRFGAIICSAHVLGTGQDATHLAHRHAALDPAENAAHFVDVGLGIETVPAFGANRLHQPIATLPGAQGHRVDAGDPGDLTNRQQRFALMRVGTLVRGKQVSHGQYNRGIETKPLL
jgi:hypothetical protein